MIFDAHSDIWTDVLQKKQLGFSNIFETFHKERLQNGLVTQGVFTIWVDPPYDSNPQLRTLDMIRSLFEEMNNAHPFLRIVKTEQDFALAASQNQFASIIGMEGLSGIGENIEWLYTLYHLGVRTASLTWNEENHLATGAKGDSKRGVTPLGFEALSLMEKLGILIDVSHANDQTFWHIAHVAKKPFIASHSNCRALCDVPRNLTDDQIKAIADSGGVIGMNAFKDFVDVNPQNQNLNRFIDHIDHIKQLVGIDHIGFGFDFFDFLSGESLDSFAESENNGIIGFENISKTTLLLQNLSARGYSDEDIEKISYLNFRRVYSSVL